MTGGEIIGGERLKAFTARLSGDLAELRLNIGQKAHHVVEAAVVANFERKRPEWPGYKSAAYAAYRQRMGRRRMLVFHGELKGAIESGFDEDAGTIWCGIPGKGGNSKLEKIARAHEFGTATVPERSYLRTGFNDARRDLPGIARKEAVKMVKKWS